MLTLSQLKTLMTYDPETGVFNWNYSRQGSGKTNKEAGHITNKGYRRIRILGNNYFASRVAWLYMTSEWPPDEMQVDHKNGNKLDNRWVNLRICTPEENSRNYGPQINNKLATKGVCFRDGKYEAYIYFNSKLQRIGRYTSLKEAENAYAEKSKEFHKEFSFYNREIQ